MTSISSRNARCVIFFLLSLTFSTPELLPPHCLHVNRWPSFEQGKAQGQRLPKIYVYEIYVCVKKVGDWRKMTWKCNSRCLCSCIQSTGQRLHYGNRDYMRVCGTAARPALKWALSEGATPRATLKRTEWEGVNKGAGLFSLMPIFLRVKSQKTAVCSNKHIRTHHRYLLQLRASRCHRWQHNALFPQLSKLNANMNTLQLNIEYPSVLTFTQTCLLERMFEMVFSVYTWLLTHSRVTERKQRLKLMRCCEMCMCEINL